MTIGQRIEQARKAGRLSQRSLALAANISAMAVSKYERDESVPSSGVLSRLAQSLGVQVEYFFRPAPPEIKLRAYRKHATLPAKAESAIQARIQEWLERYLEVEDLLTLQPDEFRLPHFPVHALDDAETAALELREAWHLGLDPIENLTELLEDQGIKVGLMDGFDHFDACTFLASDHPVIVVKADLSGDRQRFDLAHELGHLVMEIDPEINVEKAAHRFAGAFLVPALTARRELGGKRSNLSLHELYLLKKEYGLSMQAWIYRAKDLEIITESTAAQLFRQFRQKGWHRLEPGDQVVSERPLRMVQLVYHALAEDLISRSRAQELLGTAVADEWLVRDQQNEVVTIYPGLGHEHLD